MLDGLAAAMYGFDRLLRDAHEEYRGYLPQGNGMVNDDWRLQAIPRQIRQLTDDPLDILPSHSDDLPRRIVNAKHHKAAVWGVGKGREVFAEPLLIRRQPALPVKFVRFRGYWR